jgi:hypothetical protein
MHSSWIADFLRRTVLMGSGEASIAAWCAELIQILRENKADHELYLFGITRDPRLPNFLLGTSQEMAFPLPLRISLTPSTAEAFLSEQRSGVRTISHELPLAVQCHPEGEDRQIPLRFYEAACFDCGDVTIVMGLIVHDSPLIEFLDPQELAELRPLMANCAAPLLQLHLLNVHRQRAEQDLALMVRMMRETSSDPKSLGILPLQSERLEDKIAEPASAVFDNPFSLDFLQYALKEMTVPAHDARQTLHQLTQADPNLRTQASTVTRSLAVHAMILRNFSNLVALSRPDVRPRQATCSLAALAARVQGYALRIAAPYQLAVRREDHIQDAEISADIDTLGRLLERLIDVVAPVTMQGLLQIRIRAGVSGENTALLEIEDNGALPEGVTPEELLNPAVYTGTDHPRLANGAGVLYQLLRLYLEKTGGTFDLFPSRSGGLVAVMHFPLAVSAGALRVGDLDSSTAIRLDRTDF